MPIGELTHPNQRLRIPHNITRLSLASVAALAVLSGVACGKSSAEQSTCTTIKPGEGAIAALTRNSGNFSAGTTPGIIELQRKGRREVEVFDASHLQNADVVSEGDKVCYSTDGPGELAQHAPIKASDVHINRVRNSRCVVVEPGNTLGGILFVLNGRASTPVEDWPQGVVVIKREDKITRATDNQIIRGDVDTTITPGNKVCTGWASRR